ncbi:Dps family protein [Streptomyces sp. YJ-C3]
MAMPDVKNDRKIAGDALQGALVDLLDLSLLAKQAHWNLYGPRFHSLHLRLDDVVAMVRTRADEVAERAATIGVSPDGQAATVAATSVLSAFAPGWIKDTEALTALSSALFTVIGRMRDRITVFGAADPVTQDLLIGVVADLEKHHWMFRAESGIPA